jgi:hypothetical protein
MCMGMSAAPTPQVSAPQVTPPTTSPDSGLSGQGAADAQRRRAAVSAGMAQNIATSPLGLIVPAQTTRPNTLLG